MNGSPALLMGKRGRKTKTLSGERVFEMIGERVRIPSFPVLSAWG